MPTDVHISERLRKAIVLHVVKNYTAMFPGNPLLLGIHGPSGEGKTFQCQTILEAYGIKPFLISGGQLEDPQAGEPARLLRSTYLDASKSVEQENNIAVLLINDIDTGVGNWGELVQTTVNRQTVFGELMHFVDYPERVDGRNTRRIPIILTGNDFTKLYAPLVRAGRMSNFEWKPTEAERVSILGGIFPELDEEERGILARDFPMEPIAFFSHLRTILADDQIWKHVASLEPRVLTDYLRRGASPEVRVVASLHELIECGRELQSRRLKNHLGRQ